MNINSIQGYGLSSILALVESQAAHSSPCVAVTCGERAAALQTTVGASNVEKVFLKKKKGVGGFWVNFCFRLFSPL